MTEKGKPKGAHYLAMILWNCYPPPTNWNSRNTCNAKYIITSFMLPHLCIPKNGFFASTHFCGPSLKPKKKPYLSIFKYGH